MTRENVLLELPVLVELLEEEEEVEEEEVEMVEASFEELVEEPRESTSATVWVERTLASEDSTVAMVNVELDSIVCSDWPLVRSKGAEPFQDRSRHT